MVNVVGFALFVFIMSALMFNFMRYRKSASVFEKDPVTMQDLLGVSAIRNGTFAVGRDRYCRLIDVGSLNYFLMSEEEAARVDQIFGSFLASLSFPVQFYTQTRLLDLTGVIDTLGEDIKNAPESLKPYGTALRDCLREWIDVRSVMIRNSYVVVIYDSGNPAEAKRELDHRQQLVLEGLSRCGLPVKPLNDQEIADLFYAIYNSKTRALIAPLKGAINDSLYIQGRENLRDHPAERMGESGRTIQNEKAV